MRKSKLGRVYFTKDTEDAIVEYNNSVDKFHRDIVFRERIHPALDKLAENVINRFKFPYIEGTFEDIKDQVISFIVLNLHKYSKDKGKAFSYFSIVAKNYLILHNNNGYRDENRSLYFSDSSDDESFMLEERLSIDHESETTKSDARDFIFLMVRYWDFNLPRVFKKKRDIEIASAVVELLRRSDSLDNFNKKALYVNIREMTNNTKTVHITKVINKMKQHVILQLRDYKKTGHLSDPSMFFVYKHEN
jgi:hypothetical protein